ncbi:glycosyltransferase, partial [bacterium]|nr:glycosyltransferase [bacterium]
VMTVGNGVDPERFAPAGREEARRELGLDPDERIILSVGHLVERKGFHHIVRALPLVARRHERVRLVIVGAPGEEGDFTAGIWTAIREAGMTDRVTMVGVVRHDRLALWYSAADLFCLASAKEGRPNVVLESIACGTPVVATRVWGTPEILDEDWLGILVDSVEPEPLGEALAGALAREWDRDRIAARSRDFSWEAGAERVERALADLTIGAGR